MRLFVLLAIIWPAAAAAANPSHSIQDLGTLGGDTSMAVGVNAQGHVAGSSTTSDQRFHAFFHAGAGMQDLGTLGGEESFANGLNDLDDVVGRSYMLDGSVHAFVYDGTAHTLIDLHPLLARVFGGVDSSALAIDNHRRIVGGAMMPDGSMHAFRLDLVTGTVADLHALVSLGGSNSEAFGVSDSGRVVGISDDPSGNAKAFAYDPGTGGVVQLGTLGGDFSDAQAVNAIGQVVGTAGLSAPDTFHAYLSDGQAALGAGDDTGTLGGIVSLGDGLNDSGAVVGTSFDVDGRVFATIYDRASGLRDLQSLLDSNPGWFLVEATAINAGDVIVGTGFIGGAQHAFLMTPVSTSDTTPPTLSVTHVADGNHSWNVHSPVTVAVLASDAQSGLLADPACTVDGFSLQVAGSPGSWMASIFGDGVHAVHCAVSDRAGNGTTTDDVVDVDTTAPTMTVTRLPAANGKGWNNGPVTVTFNCADALSGLGAGSPPAPPLVSAEGINQSVFGTCMDVAGNVAAAAAQGINIDTTRPVVSYTNNLGSYTVDQAVSIVCAAIDPTNGNGSQASGLASNTCTNISGPAYPSRSA